MNIVTVFTILLQLNGLLLIWTINQKRRQATILNLVLSERRRATQKLKLAKQRRLNRKKRSCWYKAGRTDKWWKNLISGVSPKEFWKKNFRMDEALFHDLVLQLCAYISPNPHSPNRRALTADKKIAVTLYYLKDSGSLNMTADTFGIAINTTSAIIFEVCSAINKYLGPRYLHLPKDTKEMQIKISEFEAKFGMSQAFGCIAGTHIPILCPIENSQDYFSYKQYY